MRLLFVVFAGFAIIRNGMAQEAKPELEIIPTGLDPGLAMESKNDSCLIGYSCDEIATVEQCITCWGPEQGYPPVPDEEVEEECFTDPDIGLGCCAASPEDDSPTGYVQCAEWDGCDGEESPQLNSTKYCEQQLNISIADCFAKQDCCPDPGEISPTDYVDCASWDGCEGEASPILNSTAYCEQQGIIQGVSLESCFEQKNCCPGESLTGYIDCPPPQPPSWAGCESKNSSNYCEQIWIPEHSGADEKDCFESKDCCPSVKSDSGYKYCSNFSEYGWFCMGSCIAVSLSLVGEGLAHCSNRSNFVKKACWIGAAGSAVSAFISGMIWAATDENAITENPVLGILSASAVAGYLTYKKLNSVQRSLELQVGDYKLFEIGGEQHAVTCC